MFGKHLPCFPEGGFEAIGLVSFLQETEVKDLVFHLEFPACLIIVCVSNIWHYLSFLSFAWIDLSNIAFVFTLNFQIFFCCIQMNISRLPLWIDKDTFLGFS